MGEEYDVHGWRQKNTFNMYTDNIMKAYRGLWEELYKMYSGKHAMPGQKKFMMVDEFDDFVQSSGMINSELAAREIPLIFNLSMHNRVDELNESKHLEASIVEFMEMICRCAYQASFPPPTEMDSDDMPLQTTLTVKEKQDQPMYKKIENVIPTLKQNLCTQRFLKNFKDPKFDQKKGLYKLKNGKYF